MERERDRLYDEHLAEARHEKWTVRVSVHRVVGPAVARGDLRHCGTPLTTGWKDCRSGARTKWKNSVTLIRISHSDWQR
jgi:hypothetical protein